MDDDCGEVDDCPFFGTWKVNEVSLSAMFSDCNRARRSRRLTFSFSAASLRASRAATLSSSWIEDQLCCTTHRIVAHILDVLLLSLSEGTLSSSVLLLALHKAPFILLKLRIEPNALRSSTHCLTARLAPGVAAVLFVVRGCVRLRWIIDEDEGGTHKYAGSLSSAPLRDHLRSPCASDRSCRCIHHRHRRLAACRHSEEDWDCCPLKAG